MRRIEGAAEWDALVLGLDTAHVLQSYGWGELKARWGWRVERLAWRQNGRALAAAQLLHRDIAATPFRIGYVPKGPLVGAISDVGLWERVLTDIRSRASELGLSLVKIDADVPAAETAVLERWRDLGWRASTEQVQFPNTMRSDLTPGQEALLLQMKSKTRYNVRLASRRGVTVRHAGRDELATFFALYAETALRDGFGIRAEEYYLDAWTALLRDYAATLILAERDGETLAGVLPVAFGPTAYYLYGASATHGRKHMASYLAQWESVRWAIEAGCLTYDWWGGPTEMKESDPLWGVYRFKSGFGAQLAHQLGAYDLFTRPLLGRLYRLLSTVRLAAVRVRPRIERCRYRL